MLQILMLQIHSHKASEQPGKNPFGSQAGYPCKGDHSDAREKSENAVSVLINDIPHDVVSPLSSNTVGYYLTYAVGCQYCLQLLCIVFFNEIKDFERTSIKLRFRWTVPGSIYEAGKRPG